VPRSISHSIAQDITRFGQCLRLIAERECTPGPSSARAQACVCACGGDPASKRSYFLPGHDAKWKGLVRRLDRAVAAGLITSPEVVEALLSLDRCEECKAPIVQRWNPYRTGKRCRERQEAQIIAALRAIGRPARPAEVAQRIPNADVTKVSKQMVRMVEWGLLTRDREGRYWPSEPRILRATGRIPGTRGGPR
jgi:hypothetical protein